MATQSLVDHTQGIETETGGEMLTLRSTGLTTSRSQLVLKLLGHLDELLQRAYVHAQEVFEREAEGERRPWEYRGLYVSRGEAERLLVQPPGTPVVSATRNDPQAIEVFSDPPIWGEFGERLGLTAFDQAVTMLALAPEMDLRYERLYAYLQDDVTRRRPTVSLALDILCPTSEQKIEWRSHFEADSPLIQAGLLKLVVEPHRASPSWLDQSIQLDEQAVTYLLGELSLDEVLASFCKVVTPKPSRPFGRLDLEALASLLVEARRASSALTICFHGPRGTHQREVAASMASAAGALLLSADLATGVATAEHYHTSIAAVFRYAWLHDTFLFFDGIDMLFSEGQIVRLTTFMHALAHHQGVSIVNSIRPWAASGPGPHSVLNVPFSFPDFTARRAEWSTQLRQAYLPEDGALLDALAGRFVLSQDQIAEATSESAIRLRWLAAARPEQPVLAQAYTQELMAAARAQAGHDLAVLVHKVEPVHHWHDLVVSDEVEKQLREISARAGLQHRVLDEWGFGKKLSQAKGISVLFTGPSGTGKTMAAEVIANDLMLDLYTIDLSSVVSKFIGETEKNLERIFSAAERSNAILFFDEADALFGKRSEVHDAHDRYANIEVSYLLQRMEQYEGIAILATNLRGNLDEAFVRRLAYTVRFSLPEEVERLKIWEQIWPSSDLLAADVDLPQLAKAFKLSGGNIRNIALAASFFAATRGGRVIQDDLLKAVQREYEKMGKTVTLAELRAAMVPEIEA